MEDCNLQTTDITLADLDRMRLEEAQTLPHNVRDGLLDEIVKDARNYVGEQPERQVGLMCDYFEEDLARLQKVRAVRVRFGGFIPVDPNGDVPSLDQNVQFKIVFDNVKNALEKAGTSLDRVVNLIIFLKNMDYWSEMNTIYREYFSCCPSRAAIGCQDLNNTYQIEVVNLIAYKVASD